MCFVYFSVLASIMSQYTLLDNRKLLPQFVVGAPLMRNHLMECTAMCEKDPSCTFVNFFKGEPFKCELATGVVSISSQNTETRNGWQLLQRKILIYYKE